MIYSTVFPNAISICSESKVVMATTKHANFPFCLLSLFLLVTALLIPGSTGTAAIPQKRRNLNSPINLQFQSFREQEYLKRWKKAGSRRLMIGSTAPICTYNECRGCKYRCRAEQIPVDANDPINSAYHYRCVCHR